MAEIPETKTPKTEKKPVVKEKEYREQPDEIFTEEQVDDKFFSTIEDKEPVKPDKEATALTLDKQNETRQVLLLEGYKSEEIDRIFGIPPKPSQLQRLENALIDSGNMLTRTIPDTAVGLAGGMLSWTLGKTAGSLVSLGFGLGSGDFEEGVKVGEKVEEDIGNLINKAVNVQDPLAQETLEVIGHLLDSTVGKVGRLAGEGAELQIKYNPNYQGLETLSPWIRYITEFGTELAIFKFAPAGVKGVTRGVGKVKEKLTPKAKADIIMENVLRDKTPNEATADTALKQYKSSFPDAKPEEFFSKSAEVSAKAIEEVAAKQARLGAVERITEITGKSAKESAEIFEIAKQEVRQAEKLVPNRIVPEETLKAAQERLKGKTTELRTGVDPTMIKDMTIVGAAHIETGIRNFAHWSDLMVKQFGKDIEPRLTDIWNKSNKFVTEELEKQSPVPVTIEKKGTKPRETAESIEPDQQIVDNLTSALKEAKTTRGFQEKLYTEERGKRIVKGIEQAKKIGGELGFYAKLGQLKGELPKVEFETIRGEFAQAEINRLFDMIENSPKLTEWEKLPASKGLSKLFGEFGGKVPTEGELLLLKEVYGPEFVKAVLAKRTLLPKLKDLALEALLVPKALMASYDLSFGFRQGVFMAARHPKIFAKAFVDQIKFFGSEKAYQALQQSIREHPNFKYMKQGKLALTEMDTVLKGREEAFMGAMLAEKIPIVGLGVKASNRAFTGMANKMRADIFNSLFESAKRMGHDPANNLKLQRDIADFVNAGTGRGPLGSFAPAAVVLNAAFFSPRLVTSRLKLLNPATYVNPRTHPFVRREMLKTLLAFTSAGMTVLTLAKLNGLDVESDLRSADSGKIKSGNIRLDIWGGFLQYVRAAYQFTLGEVKSTTTGKITEVGEGFKPLTRLDILGRFATYKEAPVFSFATTLLRGTTALGERIEIDQEIAERFIPFVIKDIYDIAEEDPKLLPVGVLGIIGVGLQSYDINETFKDVDIPKETRKFVNEEMKKTGEISIGTPPTSVFEDKLTNEEFKKFKDALGKEMYKSLNILMKTSYYQRSNSFVKRKLLDSQMTSIREEIKNTLFPEKKQFSDYKEYLMILGFKEKEAENMAKERFDVK